MRSGGDSPAVRLAALADLQRLVGRVSGDSDGAAIRGKLGEIGGLVEADAKLTANLARAQAPMPQRLAALLRLAAGDAAPAGPAADRAKAQVLRLLREPEAGKLLAESPELQAQVRAIVQVQAAA